MFILDLSLAMKLKLLQHGHFEYDDREGNL